MRYLRYLALLGILTLPVAFSQAQVAVGVRVGPGYVGPALGYARTATMDIILTRVRLMDTMVGRDGSRAVSSSAQGPGITATTGGVGVIGLAMATTDGDGTATTVAATTGPVPTDTTEAVGLVIAGVTRAPRWAAAFMAVADAVKRPSELAGRTADGKCCQPFLFPHSWNASALAADGIKLRSKSLRGWGGGK